MAPPELTAPRAASVALAWNNQESTLGRRDALAQAAVDGELDAGGERCLERQEQHRARDLLGVFVDALAAHFDE